MTTAIAPMPDIETTPRPSRPTTRATVVEHESPLGPIALAATDVGLVRCALGPPDPVREQLERRDVLATNSVSARRWLKLARQELDAYFAGALREFTVPLDLQLANPFQQLVFTALAEVDYGMTTTYGQLATSLGLPMPAARLVGHAVARNPMLIIVPCHRVVGAGGKLVGYAGGLPSKRWLLDREADLPHLDLPLDLDVG
jgi:methylated-DNA-[protein]-cysteine S-methyltransferase